MSQIVKRAYEVYIRTTPEKLWDAITNGDVTKQYFFDGKIERSPRAPGDPMRYLDEDGNVMLDCTVIEIDPPRKLVHTFNGRYSPEEDRDPESRVTYEITPLGDVCKLALTHEHFNGESKVVEGTNRGWQIILSGLKTLLETGKPLQIEWPQEAPAS
ncbi:MAG: SRPBCC family protein [Vulcanimicrobiaceae bacterium]